jgi:uncharacterized membrane protein YfcA
LPSRFAFRIAIAVLVPGIALAASPGADAMPWWAWPILLFATTFVLGIVAVAGGIGGGVLFVPIVAGFFPFHLDFVRGAGLLLALSGALAAGPALLRGGLASVRLVMPLALAGSIASIIGAYVGLALPAQAVQTALGALVLSIAGLMAWAGRRVSVTPHAADRWALALGLHGTYADPATGQPVDWSAYRTPAGIAAFAVIGLVGGLFGLGAGWANVPALNLLMGVPLKLAMGTSSLAISIINTSAAWVYLNEGALLPILHVPSILGVMLGARVGVALLRRIGEESARRLTIGLLVVAGARALMLGLAA